MNDHVEGLSGARADGINASGNLQNISRIIGYYHKYIDELGRSVDDVFISSYAPSVYLVKNNVAFETTP